MMGLIVLLLKEKYLTLYAPMPYRLSSYTSLRGVSLTHLELPDN